MTPTVAPEKAAARAAEIALETALAHGADEVEVSQRIATETYIRFAGSGFTQVGTTVLPHLRVRVIAGGRLGAANGVALDEAIVRRTAAAALAIAAHTPALEIDLRFAAAAASADDPPASPQGISTPPATEIADAVSVLSEGFARHRSEDLRFFGAQKRSYDHVRVDTSRGRVRAGEARHAEILTIATCGRGSGFASRCAHQSSDLEVAACIDEAASSARRGRDPIEIAASPVDVLLAPAAVAEILEWMAMGSFSGDAVLEGHSFLADALGRSICDPRITVREVAGPAELTFDSEGRQRREVLLIDRGTAGAPLTCAATAMRTGGTSTGHAPQVGGGEHSPHPQHLWLDAGTVAKDDLLASIDRGIYVSRFHYVNGLLDPRRATMTGMTRDGTFLIENGKLGSPITNLRFTQDMLRALSQLGGVSHERHCVPTWWTPGGRITAPFLWIHEFSFHPVGV